MPAPLRFGRFTLDARQRRLSKDGRPVEVQGRYFDALRLMVANRGELISKERFNAEVWAGVPVTDEALTQCIRTLRRTLGDDAAAPSFIETVPKHGYRFIAPVSGGTGAAAGIAGKAGSMLGDTMAAALGGGTAGLVGGALYASSGLVSAGIGAASTMIAFMSLCLLLGVLGGAAVGLGIALGGATPVRSALGGAVGGLVIGALAGIVGNDLFVLLFGRAPQAFTGAMESAAVGLATGLSVAIAGRMNGGSPLQRIAPAVGLGLAIGAAIALAGGRLLAGSLAELAAAFPESPLRLDGLLALGLIPATMFETALFASVVTGALLVRRRLFATEPPLLSE